MKLKITDYIVAICFWILWDKIVKKVILGFLVNLKFIPPNISYAIVFFLPFVLLYELVAKLLMLQTISDKPKFIPIQLEEIPELDRTNLDAYTTISSTSEAQKSQCLSDYARIAARN
jgi:hypothetical protein